MIFAYKCLNFTVKLREGPLTALTQSQNCTLVTRLEAAVARQQSGPQHSLVAEAAVEVELSRTSTGLGSSSRLSSRHLQQHQQLIDSIIMILHTHS